VIWEDNSPEECCPPIEIFCNPGPRFFVMAVKEFTDCISSKQLAEAKRTLERFVKALKICLTVFDPK